MCGIIGIASNKPVSINIINSLKKLEYRGYDSAGLATLSDNLIDEKKCSGRVEELEKILFKNLNKSEFKRKKTLHTKLAIEEVLTKPFINQYLTDIGRTDLVQPYKKNVNGFSTYEAYKTEKDAYIKDLENLFTQWGQSYKYNGATKNDIATLMADDLQMTNAFLAYISKHGNADLAEQMKKSIMGADVESTSKQVGVTIRNERTGKDESVDMERADVKRMNKEIESMASVQDVENDIVALETFIKNSMGNASELVRIKLELLKQRRDFLMSQSASL